MYFKQILNEESGCSSYVIASRQTKEAVFVDTGIEIDEYLKLVDMRDLVVRYVIDTHIHADHVSGARKLAEATGATVCMHESAGVLFPFRALRDGERLELGQLWLDVWHTPGHRPEMISIVVTNTARSQTPGLVLTGDALFAGDVGRPDFGGSAGALQQYESVQRLLRLDDHVEVFPAHFEGSCGKGMCGRPTSTIGYERRFNPMLQLSRDGFLEALAETPARPMNMNAIIPSNRGAASMDWAQPQMVDDPPTISVAQAEDWLSAHNAVLIDVREPHEFAAARLPSAISIPQADLADRIQELPRDRDLLIVCAHGVRSLRVTHYLLWYGFRSVTSLDGGIKAWSDAGLPVEGDQPDVPAASKAEHLFHAGS